MVYVFVFNEIGLGTMALSGLVGAALGFWTHIALLGWGLAGLLMIVGDTGVRCNLNLPLRPRQRHSAWFIWPTTGGHVCYVPVWAWGIISLIIGAIGQFRASETSAQTIVKLEQDHVALSVRREAEQDHFVVTNHSGDDLNGVTLHVSLAGDRETRESKLADFSWKAGESKEVERNRAGHKLLELRIIGHGTDSRARPRAVSWRWTTADLDRLTAALQPPKVKPLGKDSFDLKPRRGAQDGQIVQVTNRHLEVLHIIELTITITTDAGGGVDRWQEAAWKTDELRQTLTVAGRNTHKVRIQGEVRDPQAKIHRVDYTWDFPHLAMSTDEFRRCESVG